MPPELPEGLPVLHQHRLLDEHEAVGFQLLHEYPGHGGVNPSVEVHGDVQGMAEGVPQGLHPGKHFLHLCEAVDPGHFLRAVHLDGGHPRIDPLFGLRHDVVGTVAADPGVDPHFVPHGAAHHPVDGQAGHFSGDVPEGLLDA